MFNFVRGKLAGSSCNIETKSIREKTKTEKSFSPESVKAVLWVKHILWEGYVDKVSFGRGVE